MAELDDDREEFGPDASAEDAGDPAAAFDALRETVESLAGDLTREMTTIRKGVEAAFEEFDRQGPTQDYKPELAQIVQQLAHVGERLQGVEQSPILKRGAEHYAAMLERSGEGLVRTAAQQLERQAADLERAGRVLSLHVASAREHHVQNRLLWSVGGAGLFLGILLTLFAPRVLPGPVDMAVASTAMNADHWNAGIALMKSGSPGGWNNLISANDLVRDNRPALTACAEAAAKAGQDHRGSAGEAGAMMPIRRFVAESPTQNSSFAMRRVIRLIDEMSIQACDEAMEASQSFASRRQRLSQAKVRSTIQRLGRITKPLA